MTNLNLNGKPPVYEPETKRMTRSVPMMLINEISRMMSDRIQQRSSDTPVLQKSARLLLMEKGVQRWQNPARSRKSDASEGADHQRGTAEARKRRLRHQASRRV